MKTIQSILSSRASSLIGGLVVAFGISYFGMSINNTVKAQNESNGLFIETKDFIFHIEESPSKERKTFEFVEKDEFGNKFSQSNSSLDSFKEFSLKFDKYFYPLLESIFNSVERDLIEGIRCSQEGGFVKTNRGEDSGEGYDVYFFLEGREGSFFLIDEGICVNKKPFLMKIKEENKIARKFAEAPFETNPFTMTDKKLQIFIKQNDLTLILDMQNLKDSSLDVLFLVQKFKKRILSEIKGMH